MGGPLSGPACRQRSVVNRVKSEILRYIPYIPSLLIKVRAPKETILRDTKFIEVNCLLFAALCLIRLQTDSSVSLTYV